MNALSLAALALAARVSAQAGPAARISDLIVTTDMSGAPAPTLVSFPAPSAPSASAPSNQGSIVPPDLWASLRAPSPALRAWLSSNFPDLDLTTVRELPIEQADALLSAAVDRHQSPIDFFSDPAFRGNEVYYLSKDTVAKLFERYLIPAVTIASGKTKKGTPFSMQAMVLGRGRIDTLYDLDHFKFEDDLFPGNTYVLTRRVTERILGPSDMSFEGVAVDCWPLEPKILKVVKISSSEVRIVTNYIGTTKPILFIKRR